MPCEPPSDLENDRPTQLTLPPSPTVTTPTTSRRTEHDSDLNSDSSSDESNTEHENEGFDPRARALSLRSKPPSYSTVFPDPNKMKKLEKLTFLDKIKKNIKKTSNSTNNQSISAETQNQPIATISGTNLNDPNLQQPITYDELYRNINSQTSIQNRLNNKLIKRFKRLFGHSYYLRHFSVVTLCSFSSISLQIILISNNALYSGWCSGIWTGLLNLFILLLSVYTFKYIKMWLIIFNMIFHIIGIAINISTLAVVNVPAFLEYGKCSIQQLNENSEFNDNRQTVVCSDLLKYGNLVMILINFTIVGMLLGFLIKLIVAVQRK